MVLFRSIVFFVARKNRVNSSVVFTCRTFEKHQTLVLAVPLECIVQFPCSIPEMPLVGTDHHGAMAVFGRTMPLTIAVQNLDATETIPQTINDK